MTPAAIKIAVTSRFNTLVAITRTPDLPFVFENVAYKPPATLQAYARIYTVFGEKRLTQIGGTLKDYRRVGRLQVQLHSALNIGEALALELADLVELSFQSVSAGGITYRTPTTTTVGADGGWWRVDVSCPFFVNDQA